jgi:23S rRNA pseudouridine955/2504/2580 synthase
LRAAQAAKAAGRDRSPQASAARPAVQPPTTRDTRVAPHGQSAAGQGHRAAPRSTATTTAGAAGRRDEDSRFPQRANAARTSAGRPAAGHGRSEAAPARRAPVTRPVSHVPADPAPASLDGAEGAAPAAASAEKAPARNLTISEDRDGQRLDNFLLGHLKGAPRSLVYKLVRSGQVRVNGGRAKAERKLDAGDEVRLPPLRLPEEGEKVAPPATFLARMEAAIVYEDARLLALNKPSGVASHGGSGISFGAIETLRALRPGQTLELVHRLDRDTSGLLIVAKKRSTLTEMQALLREGDSENGRGISKRYLTLLVGRMPDGVMTVDAPLHIGLRQGGERHVQVHAAGKPSLSHFRVLERRGGHSYCEVRIETGRTHQIRVHAQHLGHAVAGDDKYGEDEVNKRLRDQVGLRRLFLHAASLEFALDGGKTPYVLNAPLAPELAEVLDKLG